MLVDARTAIPRRNRRARDDDLLRQLWARLEQDDRPVCGVEHEYEVHDPTGAVVDVRPLIDGLGLGRRLDPGDPHAHRGEWGGVVTADGREAEVVSPPVAVGPGAADALHAWAVAGRRYLLDHLPPSHTVIGYSTHISVAVPDGVVRRVADMMVRHFSPALMLVLDRRTSPGLLVRPRPGRLEVGGEFAQGRTLRQAVAVVAAAAQHCEEAAGSRRRRTVLPPLLEPVTVPSRIRYGTYVDRTAFGPDLYATGRGALLRRRGGTMAAGDHLLAVVDLLGGRLGWLLRDDDLAALQAIAAGALPLPVETPEPLPDDPPRTHVDSLDLRGRQAGGLTVEMVSATWWTYVFTLHRPTVTRWLTVPRPWVQSFLTELHAGRLDDVLAGLLASRA